MACFNNSYFKTLAVSALVLFGLVVRAEIGIAADGPIWLDAVLVSDEAEEPRGEADTPHGEAAHHAYEKEATTSSAAGAKVMTLNPPIGKQADKTIDPKTDTTEKKPAQHKPSVGKKKDGTAQSHDSKKVSAPPKTLTPLPEELVQLRENVRKTINSCFRYQLDTNNFTTADLLEACLAYGCDAEVRDMSSEGKGESANAFVCLCWNLPSAGFELLRLDNRGEIMPRIGYGYQEYPGQFLAVLALSRVSEEYPIRVGNKVGKVSDLVEYEKRSCRAGMDQSMKLIGLSRYIIDDHPWKNDLGETWSKERLLEEELNRAQMRLPNGGLNHLIGISYAIDRRTRRDKPITGEYHRAKSYINDYIQYAVNLQEDDGSWHPAFFDYQGKGGSVEARLRSTGYILDWLVTSLSDKQLRSKPVTQAVKYVVFGLNRVHGQRSVDFTSSQAIQARMHAIHALMTYDARVFEPFDEEETEEVEEAPTEETASLAAPRR